MGWWKADPESEPIPALPTSISTQTVKPAGHPTPSDPSAVCPVDSKTREIWLEQAKQQRERQQPQQPPVSAPSPNINPNPILPQPTQSASKECSSSTISQSPSSSDPQILSSPTGRPLSHDRETSTIPRAMPNNLSDIPSNSESETGTSSSGNWIYPSESQFFAAVMRKSTTTTSASDLASSVSSIIPIHNAVNERAWHQIKKWEGDTSRACGGPKLLSFEGKGAGALTPRAKWKVWIEGAREPFDRHDWVIERCDGTKVDYVIDFYSGQGGEQRRMDQGLNFYLDVRPKLNSFEGARLRFERYWGLGASQDQQNARKQTDRTQITVKGG